MLTYTPWLKPGARVRKSGAWARVRLPDGALGTVLTLDTVDGDVLWFQVKWDGHTGYSDGVWHPGWHAEEGNVVPVLE